MSHRVTIMCDPLKPKTIKAAIRGLKMQKAIIERRYEEFLLVLAIKIETFLNALYNTGSRGFNKGFEVNVDADQNGITINFEGESVAFIEFGAGIYAENGKYESFHNDFYPGSWSDFHAGTYWMWQHGNTPNKPYQYNQVAQHGFDKVIDNMNRWIDEAADEVFGKK